MKIHSIVVAIIATVFICACASLPEIPYDRMSAGETKTIGIVTPRIPEKASVILASSVGQSFGLVGALVDAGLQANRESHFKTMLEQQRFSTQEAFLARLKEQLQMRGYALSDVSVMRPSMKFLEKYPADANVDAYLDLVVSNYGYVSAGIGSGTPYRPQFALQVRLVNAKTSSVLMQDTILYNPVGPTGYDSKKAITITPGAEYQFTDFDQLEANSQKAVEGLRHAAYESADMIGNLLK